MPGYLPRTHVEIPVFVNRAKKEGPFLLLLAGLHGDEVNGVEILRRLIRGGYHKPTAGAIISIPIMNIFGFISQRREVPDGRDLNRVFPGSPQGSLASRIAWTLLHEIVQHVDYALDFHTGGASRANYPQVRCVFEDDESRELAEIFSPPFVVASKYLDKSLRKNAKSIGKSVLLYEGGESLRIDEYAVQEGVKGALRVLHHLGLRKESPPPDNPPRIAEKNDLGQSQAFRYVSANYPKRSLCRKGRYTGYHHRSVWRV